MRLRALKHATTLRCFHPPTASKAWRALVSEVSLCWSSFKAGYVEGRRRRRLARLIRQYGDALSRR